MKKKSRTEYEKRLIKDIYNLKRNIERRFANIQKRNLDSPALEKYLYKSKKGNKFIYDKKLINGKRFYDTKTKGKTQFQLQVIFNRLSQLNKMSTSTVKGAKRFTYYVNPLLQKIVNSDNSSKIISLYNRFVEENILLERYKYEVLETIYENIEKSDEDIREEINKLYEEMEKQESSGIKYDTSITF